MADHIQIGDVAPRINHAGDGTETDFTFPFPIFSDADLEVYIDGVKQVLSTGYTVSGAGQSAGGLVSFATAPDDGADILLLRTLTIARTTDFQASGEFRAKVINDELDFQTAALQQINDELGRTVRLKRTDAAASLELPDAATRASCALTFDVDGNVNVTSLSDIGDLAVISSATPAQASASGSAGTSTELSAADHRHPLPALADLGIASQAEAVAGTDNTKAMTPLRTAEAIAAQFDGTDEIAREMAASALAYAMAANDASSITGSVGTFWLSDDFESDSLSTSTNATYDATGDYYHNQAGVSDTDAIPVMTGLTTPSGTVTSSNSNSTAWQTFDSSNSSYHWDASGSWASGYLAYEFTSAKVIGGYGLKPRQVDSNDLPGAPTSWTFCGWNGSGWDVLDTRSGVSFSSNTEFKSYTIASPASYTRYAIRVTGSQSYPGYGIGNLEMYEVLSPDDMTLSPGAATLSTADPLDVIGYFVIEPVDTVTFGTDIVGKMSIDGGTTKVTGTWTKIGDIGADGEALWRLEADVSAGSGSSLSYEITTFNSKQIRLHDCVGLIASY